MRADVFEQSARLAKEMFGAIINLTCDSEENARQLGAAGVAWPFVQLMRSPVASSAHAAGLMCLSLINLSRGSSDNGHLLGEAVGMLMAMLQPPVVDLTASPIDVTRLCLALRSVAEYPINRMRLGGDHVCEAALSAATGTYHRLARRR